ncbi:MAG TPA: class I SAM-dependent methyltransferase [Patescibacteria group bacterium]
MGYFETEYYRNFLAKNGNLIRLKATYLKRERNILNKNTSHFWDKKFNLKEKRKEFSYVEEDRINIVYKFLKRRKGKLLDLGFGQAKLENLLQKELGIELFGLDISPTMVKRAKRNLRGDYKFGSVFRLPYESNFFDFIIAMEILEHITPSKVFKVYKGMLRILKKNGYLIVTVPMNEPLQHMVEVENINPNGHMRVYTPELIKSELRIAGFTCVAEFYLYAFRSGYKWKKMFVKYLPFVNRLPNNIVLIAKKI